MKLYHGSNKIIRKPDLSKGRKFLDFGSGFYLPNPKEFVIQLFQPEKLATQYLFSTAKSLQYLHFTDSYTI